MDKQRAEKLRSAKLAALEREANRLTREGKEDRAKQAREQARLLGSGRKRTRRGGTEVETAAAEAPETR